MGGVDRFGPDRRPRALVLTFDNLGEASALERGEQAAPTGRDPSVTEVLPWLLEELHRPRRPRRPRGSGLAACPR
jgi:hypothetical protein